MPTPNAGVPGFTALPFPVEPESVPGLSSCLEDGRLLAGGRPLPISVVDIDALRLVEHAVARGRSLFLCPSDPLSRLVALIPAAAHVASMVRGHRAHGVPVGSRLRIAVVTGDYEMRGFYRGLAIRPHAGAIPEPLRAVVPAGAIGAGGTVHVLQGADRSWSTVFVRTVAELNLVGPIDLVVVDMPVADPHRLADASAPVIIVCRDPADAASCRLARTMASFAWDAVLGEESGGSNMAGLTGRLHCDVEIVPVTDPVVCDNAGLFWDDIGPLCRVAAGGLGGELAREAFTLFHDLLGLALPLPLFEELDGRSIAARLGALRRACELLSTGDLRELYLPMVEAELKALADAVKSGASKPAALPRVLAESLDERRDVLLVVRTAALARAYIRHLAQAGLGRVRVSSLGALATERPASVAVLTGIAPTWGRWVYRSAIAPTLRVLAYTQGSASAGGFDEVDIVRRIVANQRQAAADLSTPQRRVWSWGVLHGSSARDLPEGSPQTPPDVNAMDLPPPAEAPPGLWEAGRWMADLETTGVSRSDSGARLDRLVAGLRVEFADGTWAVLAADEPVSRWRRNSGRLDVVAASEVKVDDELVFLDEDAHKTLVGKVLEVAETVPALAVSGAWLAHWRLALLTAHRAAGSYARLTERLAHHGCRVQAQTVRLWVVGVTLGPEDPEDVRRVGLVAGDTVLLSARDEIVRAMRTLRGAHGRLSRRLADMARHLGPAVSEGRLPADEMVDETSGLTAADIESAVTLATVVAIEPLGEVPAVLTGRRMTMENQP